MKDRNKYVINKKESTTVYKGQLMTHTEIFLDGAKIQRELDAITNTETLEEHLKQNIEEENYERAAQIQKVLKERR